MIIHEDRISNRPNLAAMADFVLSHDLRVILLSTCEKPSPSLPFRSSPILHNLLFGNFHQIRALWNLLCITLPEGSRPLSFLYLSVLSPSSRFSRKTASTLSLSRFSAPLSCFLSRCTTARCRSRSPSLLR